MDAINLHIKRRYINEVLFTIKHTSYSLKSAESENICFTMLSCNACCPIGNLLWIPSIYTFFKKTIQAGMG